MHDRFSQRHVRFILDKVQAKLAGWKVNLMSFAARKTIVKQVIASIPAYYMQCLPIPNKVCKNIDILNRRFL